MRCSWVMWVGCCWAAGAWAGPLPLDQRPGAEPEARLQMVDVAPVGRPDADGWATAWTGDAPPTQAADLALVPADLPADGAHVAQADTGWIVAVAADAAVAAVPEGLAETNRWLSREWSSLPADYHALPDAGRSSEAAVELPRQAVIGLGTLVAGMVVAVLARLWLRRSPTKHQGGIARRAGARPGSATSP